MKRAIKTCLLYLSLLLLPGFLFAADSPIWEASANEYFKLASQDTSALGGNDHPVELDSNKIARVLGGLSIGKPDKGDGEAKKLFTDKQAELLGQHLAAGLARAKPDQDIIFAMERNVSRFYGLSDDQFFVAGRAFFKAGKLNLIIGDYDRPRDKGYEAAYDPTHVGIVRYNFDHGQRDKSSKRFVKPVSKLEGVDSNMAGDGARPDWLVIDVDKASAAHAKKVMVREILKRDKKRQELLNILQQNKVQTPPAPDSVSRPTPVPAPVPVPAASDPLEERFAKLKRLKEKGLITEEEYAEKKRQLLDEL